MEIGIISLVINGLLAIIMFFGGFILKAIWDGQKANASAIGEIHSEHLPKKVDKTDFADSIKALFAKLDRIEDKLDGKQDKNGNGNGH